MKSDCFLSCDWGTTHFRLRLVGSETLQIFAEIKTPEGAAQVHHQARDGSREQAFSEVFQRHARDLLNASGKTTTHAIISGMASSAIGWQNLPYALAPFPLKPQNLNISRIALDLDGREMTIQLISGVQTQSDMMRGEETELLGLLHALPALQEGNVRLIFPGTHSKHLRVQDGSLIEISTFMTGELFSHLQTMPTLLPMMDANAPFSESDFLKGVACAAEHGFDASLFSIRASSVLSTCDAMSGTSFLSGLLIGSELSHMDKNSPVQLFGTGLLSERYLRAAQNLGLQFELIPADVVERSLVLGHSLFLAHAE